MRPTPLLYIVSKVPVYQARTQNFSKYLTLGPDMSSGTLDIYSLSLSLSLARALSLSLYVPGKDPEFLKYLTLGPDMSSCTLGIYRDGFNYSVPVPYTHTHTHTHKQIQFISHMRLCILRGGGYRGSE